MNFRLAIYAIAAVLLGLSWSSACIIYRAAEMGARVAPLEEREFEDLTVIAVGTGSAYENPVRRGPCTALGLGSQVILVDVGRGVAEGLRLAKIPLTQPDTILLTSLMPENTLGLDDLIFTGWLTPREHPLRVIGPPGTSELTLGLLDGYRRGIEVGRQALGLPALGIALEVYEVEDQWQELRDGLRFSSGALSGGPLPALAWRFEHEQTSVVVGGTGWAPEDLVEFAGGADMLVHEAVYIPTPEDAEAAGITVEAERLVRESALHTSILDIGNLAARARVGSLVLVRLRPPPMFDFQVTRVVRSAFSGRIVIPDDGDELHP